MAVWTRLSDTTIDVLVPTSTIRRLHKNITLIKVNQVLASYTLNTKEIWRIPEVSLQLNVSWLDSLVSSGRGSLPTKPKPIFRSRDLRRILEVLNPSSQVEKTFISTAVALGYNTR
jgi:hypothetical protein